MEPRAEKKYVVLGCGKAGMSVVRFLVHRHKEVLVSDTRGKKEVDPHIITYLQENGVETEWGGHTEAFVLAADCIVPSPGVPLDLPVLLAAQERGRLVLGELAFAADLFPVPVIAVTGSNGKTTVTSLVSALFRAAGKQVFVGGNIGTPLLDYFVEKQSYDLVVLELSSFQLELVGGFRPDIAVVLNLSPDHLDRHHSMAAYVAAKLNVLRNQRKGDIAVLGGDDATLCAATIQQNVRRLFFGTSKENEAFIDGNTIVVHALDASEEYLLEGSRMSSPVNRLNAAASILVARQGGCPKLAVQEGLQSFTPPRHRMTEVAEIEGVRYVNDSKATNVGAMAAALRGFGRVVLIAGGRDKEGDFDSVRKLVSEKVKQLIVFGEAAGKLSHVFSRDVPVMVVQTMQEAVTSAGYVAISGDVVLLAPGCASFDMFSGYEERGDRFTDCVMRLACPHNKGN